MMLLAALVFTGISLLIWYLITGFMDLGALKVFLIFLATGPLYLLASWLSGTANQNNDYRGSGVSSVGSILAAIGISIFAIMSISPFFSTWKAITGFWPHFLLVLLGFWVVYLLIHALLFVIRLFTS
jgi:hypothetical protein